MQMATRDERRQHGEGERQHGDHDLEACHAGRGCGCGGLVHPQDSSSGSSRRRLPSDVAAEVPTLEAMGLGLHERTIGRLPRPWRTLADWVLTIAVAVAVVLVVETKVAKPFRVPSSSMEPTLKCARPAEGCTASMSDRVIACRLCYRFGSPKRGQIV